MTKNLDKDGLSSIVDNYQLFYIDLWGVVHNGVTLHQEAIKALNEISKKGKEYILLTNAPRPNACLLYTSPSPRDGLLSRMPSSA